jgi:CheY-like chemotaxis protein
MSKVILIVDDDKDLLKIFSDVLSGIGYRTLGAEDGLIGVTIAKALAPHLILMDIHMPVMNGFEALRMLQSESKTKNIPCIALTSLSLPEGRDGFLKLGFADHIEKPVNLKDLRQIVDKCLNPIY